MSAAEGLRRVLADAFSRARRTGCTMHVSRTGAGVFFASEYIPVLEQRANWLRVRADGMVENGHTRKRVGHVTEVGVGA